MYARSLVIVIDDLASLFQDDQHLHKHRHTQTYEDAIEIGGIKNRKKPRKLVVVGRKNTMVEPKRTPEGAYYFYDTDSPGGCSALQNPGGLGVG